MAQNREPDDTTAVIDTTEVLGRREITSTHCPKCEAEVHGVNGRFACTRCDGWASHWSEGTSELMAAEDDPDYPGL